MKDKKPPLMPAIIFRRIDEAVREVYGETFCMVICHHLHNDHEEDLGFAKRLVLEPRKTYDKLLSLFGSESLVKTFLGLIFAKLVPNYKIIRPVVESLIEALKADDKNRVLKILEKVFS